MLSTILDTVFNGLLVGASGYVMFSLKPPEHPFAFAASLVGLCHGCTGICKLMFDNSNDSEYSETKCLNRARLFTTSCMEIVAVPLINMDFYRSSQLTNTLALGHGVFIIPLAFDLIFRVFAAGEAEDDSMAVLKDLTTLGNIVSLLFYAINENTFAAGIMTVSAFFAYYGASMMENILSGTGENFSLVGYAVFLGLIPAAIRAGADEAVAS